jgi:hypothetical protein
MKEIVATFDTYVHFEIPENVFLLPEEENDSADDDTPGKWWVKWGTLYYFDQNKNIVEINGIVETNYKWPTNVSVEED